MRGGVSGGEPRASGLEDRGPSLSPPFLLCCKDGSSLVECNWLHYSEQVPDEVLPIIIKGLCLRGTSLWPSLLQESAGLALLYCLKGTSLWPAQVDPFSGTTWDSLVHLGLPFSKVG